MHGLSSVFNKGEVSRSSFLGGEKSKSGDAIKKRAARSGKEEIQFEICHRRAGRDAYFDKKFDKNIDDFETFWMNC